MQLGQLRAASELTRIERLEVLIAAEMSKNGSVEHIVDTRITNKKRKKSSPTPPSTVWFAWQTQEPRMWISYRTMSKQKYHEFKYHARMTKLFLPRGFALAEDSSAYHDDVRKYGELAEANLIEFLRSRALMHSL